MEWLEKLLASQLHQSFLGTHELETGLARDDVVELKEISLAVVTMNSTVKFAVESAEEEFCLKLEYPKDLDGSGDSIAILAAIGSALS